MRDLDRLKSDPTSTAATKDMVDVIRKMYQNNNEKYATSFDMQAKENNYRTSR